MTKNTIDEILENLFTNPTEDGDDYYEPRFTKEEAKQALYQDLIDMVGDDEIGNIGYDGEEMVDDTSEEMHIRNRYRRKLRQNINQYFGKEDK
jgi:hypothetical protein